MTTSNACFTAERMHAAPPGVMHERGVLYTPRNPRLDPVTLLAGGLLRPPAGTYGSGHRRKEKGIIFIPPSPCASTALSKHRDPVWPSFF